MIDIEKQVLDWHKETFPNSTNDAIREKYKEEIQELFEKPFDFYELADVCIVGIALLNRYGITLSEAIGAKLEINKNRIWGKETKNGDRPRKKQEAYCDAMVKATLPSWRQ